MLRPGRKPREISLALRVREAVEVIARRPGTPQKIAMRARIVLAAADGQHNPDILEALHIHENTVCKWRRRWGDAGEALQRLCARLEPDGIPCVLRKLADAIAEEILCDAPRSGSPPCVHRRTNL